MELNRPATTRHTKETSSHELITRKLKETKSNGYYYDDHRRHQIRLVNTHVTAVVVRSFRFSSMATWFLGCNIRSEWDIECAKI